MRRAGIIALSLAVIVLITWRFPLFRLLPLEATQTLRQATAFNAAAHARAFWEERLTGAIEQAADTAAVVAAITRDPASARDRYGRSVGLSRAGYYLLAGRGTVTAIERNGLRIALDGGETDPAILLFTGLVFGNAVRDALGAFEVSDFADSRQFNEVAAELNRIVETGVIPPLREAAAIGRRLEFVGCLEVIEEAPDWDRRAVIPVRVRWLD